MEAIHAKRKSLEKLRQESAAESGDDEDEELGNSHVRQRSPKRNVKRSSKLGTEMMRTNSQGSVVSSEDLHSFKEGGAEVGSTILEESAAEVDAMGHLTPPETFPQKPGNHVENIGTTPPPTAMGDPDATPKPHGLDQDPNPTPRYAGSPSHRG
jgi:serine/threonine-protein kinase RIM15